MKVFCCHNGVGNVLKRKTCVLCGSPHTLPGQLPLRKLISGRVWVLQVTALSLGFDLCQHFKEVLVVEILAEGSLYIPNPVASWPSHTHCAAERQICFKNSRRADYSVQPEGILRCVKKIHRLELDLLSRPTTSQGSCSSDKTKNLASASALSTSIHSWSHFLKCETRKSILSCLLRSFFDWNFAFQKWNVVLFLLFHHRSLIFCIKMHRNSSIVDVNRSFGC